MLVISVTLMLPLSSTSHILKFSPIITDWPTKISQISWIFLCFRTSVCLCFALSIPATALPRVCFNSIFFYPPIQSSLTFGVAAYIRKSLERSLGLRLPKSQSYSLSVVNKTKIWTADKAKERDLPDLNDHSSFCLSSVHWAMSKAIKYSLKSRKLFPSESNIRKIWSQKLAALPDGNILLNSSENWNQFLLTLSFCHFVHHKDVTKIAFRWDTQSGSFWTRIVWSFCWNEFSWPKIANLCHLTGLQLVRNFCMKVLK